jgi:hypothetical protein
MKKLLQGSIVLSLFALSVFIFQLSCKKDASAQNELSAQSVENGQARICNIVGVYSGTSKASTGATSTLAYRLQNNDFAVSSLTLASANVTFGSYTNTCDSVFITVYYTGNSSYYALNGRLRNNKTVISGTFQNLTTPSDHGTFNIVKQ